MSKRARPPDVSSRSCVEAASSPHGQTSQGSKNVHHSDDGDQSTSQAPEVSSRSSRQTTSALPAQTSDSKNARPPVERSQSSQRQHAAQVSKRARPPDVSSRSCVEACKRIAQCSCEHDNRSIYSLAVFFAFLTISTAYCQSIYRLYMYISTANCIYKQVGHIYQCDIDMQRIAGWASSLLGHCEQ